MDEESIIILHDRKESITENEAAKSKYPDIDVKDASILSPRPTPPQKNAQGKKVDWKGSELLSGGGDVEPIDASGDVNMDASITTEDVIRAGGFGARDDISSFLPVASDSTDFEASIRDARNYEEPQGEPCRPGLGWTNASGRK